ncbi:hypothetical protein FBU30_006105 [Linnemannia zychae]|nr:hypothetical protein FBU30_006105 [Linnemannia zychae]
MAIKCSKLTLLATVYVVLIAQSSDLLVEAAPIDRLLALIPASSTYYKNHQTIDNSNTLQPPPQPSHGRAQIRPIGQRYPSVRGSLSQIPSSDPSTTVWHLLRQAQQQQQIQQQKMQSILSVRIQQQQKQQTPTEQSPHPSPYTPDIWLDRTLGGHAVLDDDDDDAGNELLDTEFDGLLRPDADDEIEGTIEGEVLEEEEEEEEMHDKEIYEYDDENENREGNIYDPWLAKPVTPSSAPYHLAYHEGVTQLARVRGGDEESL